MGENLKLVYDAALSGSESPKRAKKEVPDFLIKGFDLNNTLFANVLPGLEKNDLQPGDIAVIVKDAELRQGDIIARKSKTRWGFDFFKGTHLRLVYSNGVKIKTPEKDRDIIGKLVYIVRRV